MQRQKSLTALVALSLLFASVSAHAQDESPPNVADLWVVTVDYANAAAFEEAFKTHGVARKEAGDPRSWQVYTAAAGGELNTYSIYSCCFKWADADAYDEWTLDSGIMGHWNEQVAQYVDDYRHQFQVVDLDNSNWPDDASAYNYFGVTSWQPKPGAENSRQAALKAFTAVAKENGWSRPWSWSYGVGGDAEMILVSPYVNYADMEPPEQSFFEFVAEHLGAEEAARLFGDFGNSFWSSEYTIYLLRRDLSMGDGVD